MEKIVIIVLVVLGALLMVSNIVRYIIFARQMNDGITRKNKTVGVWLTVGLILLVFFLIGYLVVGIWFNIISKKSPTAILIDEYLYRWGMNCNHHIQS